jgi:hypothetical protein
MKKQTIAIVLGIFLISLSSAIYAGECDQVNISELGRYDNLVYTSIGNQSNLEGLNVTLNGTVVDICPAINYKPDNFTLVFWDNPPEIQIETKTVIEYRSGGGGTKYVDRNVTKYIERLITEYLEVDYNETTCEEILQDEKDFWNKKGLERFWNWISNLFITNK